MGVKIILLTVIGGCIGWLTNVLAIKLLFKPIKPIKIPIINIEIMGLIPKRRREIAKSISEIVERELLSTDDLVNLAFKEEDKSEINYLIKDKIKNTINEKIDFIPYGFRAIIGISIEKLIDEEVNETIDEIKDKVLVKAKERIDIKRIVEEKIEALDLEKLEKIVMKISKKELKHIEVLGLCLGAIIGFLQSLIVIFL